MAKARKKPYWVEETEEYFMNNLKSFPIRFDVV